MGNGGEQGLAILVWLLMIGGGLILQAIVCWLLMTCYAAIPEGHRKMEPMMVWLLMIPLFNLVWNFFTYPRLAESFRSYFDSRPELGVQGDCGKTLGLVLSILFAVSVVPCLGFFTGIAGLVVLIIFLIKAFELRRKVLDSAT